MGGWALIAIIKRNFYFYFFIILVIIIIITILTHIKMIIKNKNYFFKIRKQKYKLIKNFLGVLERDYKIFLVVKVC